MSGDTFSQTNQDKATGIQGSGNTVNVNHGKIETTFKDVFDEILPQLVDKEFPAGTDETIVNEFDNPSTLMSAAYDQAELDVANASMKVDNEFKTQTKTWYARFKTLMPLGLKVTTAVSSAVLSTYINRSPVIAGLQAFIEVIQSSAE